MLTHERQQALQENHDLAVPTPLRLVKKLVHRPEFGRIDGISLRRFQNSEDIDNWLSIHEAVFRPLSGTGRPWTPADFRREFLDKPEWHDGAMWFAVSATLNPIGTVTWTPSIREAAVGHIRWLAVVPAWRRQGIATRLLQQAERGCFERACTLARLETLPSWEGAVAFYRARGLTEAE